MRVGVFGLGEAGSLVAADLVEAGVRVKAFDPANVETPKGVIRCETPAQVVVDANFVLALTAAADARNALEQAFDDIPADVVYADFATGAASLKQKLATQAAKRRIAFADVALLAVVPGNGIRTKALSSGTGSCRFADTFRSFGMPVESIGEKAGEAATRKLLRSIFMKGLAGVMIEALQAAHAAELGDWLWENLSTEIAQADEGLIRRLVSGTAPHARRRLHEMEAAGDLLEELGVDPVMTRGTIENLQRVLEQGLPRIP